MAVSRARRWTIWLSASLVAAVVAVVGGTFIYIHFISGKAPAPFSLPAKKSGAAPSSSSPGSPATASSLTGTWKVAAGSQAGYRVKEVLFGQNNIAAGRTNAITGHLTVNGTHVTAGTFTVQMATIKSDQSQRDGQFQGRIMNTSQFPTATFELTSPIVLASIPDNLVEVTVQVSGKLTLHGTTKDVTFPLKARRNGAQLEVNGTIPITFSDYNINNPSGGPASVGNTGQLEFVLQFGPS